MNKVAIVGKPNVGKSTLFNRLIRKKQAIVNNEPGVTRDRLYGEVDWLGKKFELIDTGGLTIADQPFARNIQHQVEYAIDEADLIIFLVSNKDGINADDNFIAKLLKKHKCRNVLLVVNKSEKQQLQTENQYYALGFGKPIYIAAEHSIGVGDLLDLVTKKINLSAGTKKEKAHTSFSIIGRPNVGKSTLTNALLNEERVLVSPIPHTTRDSIFCDFSYNGKKYTLIDTAGIRRSGKIQDDIEKYSVLRTKEAIEQSQMVLLVLDGSTDFNEQDEVIGGLAYKANIPTIIVVNKWDLVKKDEKTMNKMTKLIRQRFKYLSWAPIIFISAKDKKRLQTIFNTIDDIKHQLEIKVNTSMLNDVVLRAVAHNPSKMEKGGRLSVSFASQVQGQVPTFVLFVNDPKHSYFSYERFIENTIRDAFGITNVPITVYYKSKNARIRGIVQERKNK